MKLNDIQERDAVLFAQFNPSHAVNLAVKFPKKSGAIVNLYPEKVTEIITKLLEENKILAVSNIIVENPKIALKIAATLKDLGYEQVKKPLPASIIDTGKKILDQSFEFINKTNTLIENTIDDLPEKTRVYTDKLKSFIYELDKTLNNDLILFIAGKNPDIVVDLAKQHPEYAVKFANMYPQKAEEIRKAIPEAFKDFTIEDE